MESIFCSFKRKKSIIFYRSIFWWGCAGRRSGFIGDIEREKSYWTSLTDFGMIVFYSYYFLSTKNKDLSLFCVCVLFPVQCDDLSAWMALCDQWRPAVCVCVGFVSLGAGTKEEMMRLGRFGSLFFVVGGGHVGSVNRCLVVSSLSVSVAVGMICWWQIPRWIDSSRLLAGIQLHNWNTHRHKDDMVDIAFVSYPRT